jgi:XTP/dITP diphosphohydrolase
MNVDGPACSARPTLLIATGNRGKLAEFRELLASLPVQVVGLNELPSPIEIDEAGTTYEENAAQKAQAVARHFGICALGDDTGLEVDALRGAPGIRTARFAGPAATGEQNRAKLLSELADVPTERRTARFVCHLAVADPSGVVRGRAFGECQGRITNLARGKLGFGYDALFELIEYHRTFAELGEAAKSRLSHRARAVEQLLPRLTSLLCNSAVRRQLTGAGVASDG